MAAGVFVPIASLLGHWFSPNERGVANGIYYGWGGGLGQVSAFLILPVLHVYFFNEPVIPVFGWRGAMLLVALLIGILGLGCWVFLRSFPLESGYGRASKPASPSEGVPARSSLFQDPVLWYLGGYFAASLIALRLVPGWLTIYASELYEVEWGFLRVEAVIAGGVIGTVYTVGHVFGSPILGKISDYLIGRGVGRLASAAVMLGLGSISVMGLTLSLPSPWLLGGVALVMGVTLHAFPIVNAAVSDLWGERRTGQSLGWINMVGQLAGAVALSISGYLGEVWGSGSATPAMGYAGIWYFAASACLIGTACGWQAHRLSRSKMK